eukprot:348503-Pelagomonas_calceolata.AAC.3
MYNENCGTAPSLQWVQETGCSQHNGPEPGALHKTASVDVQPSTVYRTVYAQPGTGERQGEIVKRVAGQPALAMNTTHCKPADARGSKASVGGGQHIAGIGGELATKDTSLPGIGSELATKDTSLPGIGNGLALDQ